MVSPHLACNSIYRIGEEEDEGNVDLCHPDENRGMGSMTTQGEFRLPTERSGLKGKASMA